MTSSQPTEGAVVARGIGLAVASYIKRADTAPMVANLTLFPLLSVSGVFYSFQAPHHHDRKEDLMTLRLVPLLAVLALAVGGVGIANAQAGSTSVRTVKVTAKDFRFVLSSNTIAPGRVKFVIRNVGASPHDFAIAGHTSKTIQHGQSTTLTVTFKKDKYRYRCTVDSHAELGMKGVLRVK